MTTTMGENIRYFMYKDDISIDEWKGSHNNILSKIKHVSLLWQKVMYANR